MTELLHSNNKKWVKCSFYGGSIRVSISNWLCGWFLYRCAHFMSTWVSVPYVNCNCDVNLQIVVVFLFICPVWLYTFPTDDDDNWLLLAGWLAGLAGWLQFSYIVVSVCLFLCTQINSKVANTWADVLFSYSLPRSLAPLFSLQTIVVVVSFPSVRFYMHLWVYLYMCACVCKFDDDIINID